MTKLWRCVECGQQDNPATLASCPSCGAERPHHQPVLQAEIVAVDEDEDEDDRALEPAYADYEEDDYAEEDVYADELPTKKKGAWRGIVTVVAVLLCIGLAGFGYWSLFVRAKPRTLKLNKLTWVLQVETQQLVPVQHEAWADEVPEGAKEVRRVIRVREEEVIDGTKLEKTGENVLADGTVVPVMEKVPNKVLRKIEVPWVTYEVMDWGNGRVLEARRTDGREPKPIEFVDNAEERVQKRVSYLLLRLRDKRGEDYDYRFVIGDSPMLLERARQFKVGESYTAHVNAVGKITKVASD